MDYKKSILVVFMTIAIVIIGLSYGFDFDEKLDLDSNNSLRELYEQWLNNYSVSRSLDDKQKRFNVFKENVKHIHQVNKMDRPYKLKLNQFGDMTNYEFRAHFAGSKILHHRILNGKNTTQSFMYANAHNLPSSIDWRKKGAVTPIKNQGQCG